MQDGGDMAGAGQWDSGDGLPFLSSSLHALGPAAFGGQCSSVLHHCFEKPLERAVIYERFLVQGEINL